MGYSCNKERKVLGRKDKINLPLEDSNILEMAKVK